MKSLLGDHHRTTITSAIPYVDAFQFVTGKDYLNQDLFPFQRVVIKTLYGLWQKYPPDEEEQSFIDLEKHNWGLTIDLARPDTIQYLVLAAGRRSSKTTISAAIAAYSIYKLICLGDPQAYYGLKHRQPIHILHVACKEEQAQEMLKLTLVYTSNLKFFEKYFDPNRNNRSEMGFFTPRERELNAEIENQNRRRRPGEPRTQRRPGSLTIESVTSESRTNRGKSIYCLIFSEFAHVQRAGLDENNRSDHELYVALSPSLKDFRHDGRIIFESSPKERGGEFYRHYCIGGGMEQESATDITREKSYQVFQAASWEANPNMPRESFDQDFKNDLISAEMEFGSHFGLPAQRFASPGDLENLIDKGHPFCYANESNWKYALGVDPGGKAKEKDGDAYAYAWGYYDKAHDTYVVCGMKAYNPYQRQNPDGTSEWELVDGQDVTNEIIGLTRKLGGPTFICAIAYDQYDSGMAISQLKKAGLPAFETTFTNEYKAAMFGCFFQLLRSGNITICWDGEGGFTDRLMKELRVFEREQRGDKVYYHHPHSGAIQHDDSVCAVANLIYQLWLMNHEPRQYVKDMRKAGGAPVKMPSSFPVRVYYPVRGGIPPKLKDRLR